MNRVLAFDAERGLLEVEAGIQWPEILAYLQTQLVAMNTTDKPDAGKAWAFAQKQTGADRSRSAAASSANIHGRGLADAALHQRRRVVPARSPRAGDLLELQPRARTPSCSAWRSAATACSASSTRPRCASCRGARSSAWSRCARSTGSPSAFAERIRDGLPVRRLPVRDRRDVGRLPEPRRVLVLPPGRRRARRCRSTSASSREGDWTELLYLAHTRQGRGVPALRRATTCRPTGRSTGPTKAQMSFYPEDYHRASIAAPRRPDTRRPRRSPRSTCERDALERFMAEVRDYARRDKPGTSSTAPCA